MKNKILTYRFILVSIIITQIFISNFNINNYTLMVYFVPKRTIELVFSLTLILANGYFLVDNIYYYVKMYNEIVIRSSKHSYYKLLLKKIFYCFVLLVIAQCALNYIACNNILLQLTLSYYLTFILLFFMLNRFLKIVPQDIMIIIFSFCIFTMKCMYLLILK